jgi:hypothetical protein
MPIPPKPLPESPIPGTHYEQDALGKLHVVLDTPRPLDPDNHARYHYTLWLWQLGLCTSDAEYRRHQFHGWAQSLKKWPMRGHSGNSATVYEDS